MLPAPPSPVYLTDEPIAELRSAELFLLCVARLWVVHHRDPAKPAEWRGGFAFMKIDAEGESGFDHLFQLVATRAIRSIDIRCQRCHQLGADEGRLLQLVSLLQGDRLLDAAGILRDWLRPGVVAEALGAAQAVAATFAARGLSIPLRHPEAIRTRRQAPAAAHACSALVH